MDTMELKEHMEQISVLHQECVSAGFTPQPAYRSDIDSLIFLMSDETAYAKRVNNILTVFVSGETDEVAGVEVKGFRRVLENMRRFKVRILLKIGRAHV